MSNDAPNTSQQLMADLVTLYTALEEFLLKFSESTTSFSDYTDFKWIDANGEQQTMKIPSVGHMKTDISEVKQQLEDLIRNNDDKIVLKYGDDSVRSFEMRKVSALLDNINQISDTQFNVPTEFKAKANWMFESFLNPLLYIGVDVANFVKDNDIKKFAVRRLILDSPSANDINVFNSNLKGVNNLEYDETVTFLKNQGLQYSVDDNEYELSASINRYSGSFTVLKIEKSTAAIEENEYPQNYYTLDKLYYTDAVNNSKGFTQLAVGDVLLTANDTEYRVKAVDTTNSRVLLEKIFGNEPVNIGVDVLKIKPEAYRIPELQINIGYNEYELIFVKPIANVLDLTTSEWSRGFGIYTNELSILLSSNQSIALPEYYNSYVADFGLMMLNFAKERQIPASIGIKPDAPVLNASDYKVEQINTHIREDKSYEDFKEKIATKNSLKSQLDTLNKSINDAMKSLNTISTQDEEKKSTTKKTINDYNNQKAGIQRQLSTILDEITSYIKSDTNMSTSPKYKIRGFINIPDSKSDIYGEQAIIQIVYQYRYKSKAGGASKVNNLPYTDSEGNQVQAYFSQWNEHRSDIRQKTYDSETGRYMWIEEDTQDSDKINFNQLDISITKGEIVEIRAKAISEAGYPLNPLESDWSNTIEIEFPDNLDVEEEDSILAQRLLIEDALVDFQDDLNARGLELHLSDSVNTGDRYYAHQLENIASGTFTPEGNIIDAARYIKSLSEKITALEKAISTDEGEILVKVVDEKDGREYIATNGGTVNIYAGAYKDQCNECGEIVTKQYKIRISNSSSTPLELVSCFGGSQEFIKHSDEADYSYEYEQNRKYGEVPIVIGNSNIASRQKQCQFIYSRYKDAGLVNDMYIKFTDGYGNIGSDKCNDTSRPLYLSLVSKNNSDTPSKNYMYETTKIAALSSALKARASLFDGIHILPSFNLYCQYTQLNPKIAGNFDYGANATLFCISTEHPIYKEYKESNSNSEELFTDWFKKNNYKDNKLRVCHSIGIGISSGESHVIDSNNSINLESKVQSEVDNNLSSTDGYYETVDASVKIGFYDDDRYLIGKMTCGAYLYVNPSEYSYISISGNSRTNSEATTVDIPIVFQYRCTDYPCSDTYPKGYIGGFSNGYYKYKNVSYTKTIGFDIYQKLRKGNYYAYDDVFSFDVSVTGKYKNDEEN